MVLGFKPQFKKPILDDTKKHTIREDKNDRWKPGMKIHFATGVRTRLYHQFKEGVCISTQKIEIRHFKHGIGIHIDDAPITWATLEIIAINDGFKNVSEFLNWFNEDFEGKIIHWTDLKY